MDIKPVKIRIISHLQVRIDIMKIGLMVSFSKPEKEGEHPFEPTLRFASQAGLDGVELCFDPKPPYDRHYGAWSEDLDGGEIRKILGLCQSYGIEIASLCSDWPWGYSRYCPGFEHWARGLEILRQDIRASGDLGAKVLLLHFGVTRAKGWDEAKGIISKLAAEAEDNDVVLGFEGGLWANTGLGGLRELCKMVDEVGSHHLGVYEHCYWPRGNMRPHEEIELVGNRIVGLHSGRIDAKNVDYEAMLKALKGHYDRYWVLEMDREDVKESLGSLKGILRRYW
jgi:sugar phosphate isomerase/epimerase